jgi:hypothetical protein
MLLVYTSPPWLGWQAHNSMLNIFLLRWGSYKLFTYLFVCLFLPTLAGTSILLILASLFNRHTPLYPTVDWDGGLAKSLPGLTWNCDPSDLSLCLAYDIFLYCWLTVLHGFPLFLHVKPTDKFAFALEDRFNVYPYRKGQAYFGHFILT